MNWGDLQKNIADYYCGTVLVLDDAIYSRPKKCGKARSPFTLEEDFSAVKSAFEKRGALCDLWHVEDQFNHPKLEKLILKAADRCDMLIIDWYLGRGKQDPENALKVLDELSKRPGFRFAAIHSDEKSHIVLQGLKAAFQDKLVNLEDNQREVAGSLTEEDDHVLVEAEAADEKRQTSSGVPSTFRIGESLYLCILEKKEMSQSSGGLADVFYTNLNRVFSDHLHWAGFEFAAKAKALLPRLLMSLPSGTDAAITFQSLLLESDELSDCIIESLTLELGALIKASGINAVSDDTLIQRLSDGVLRNADSIKCGFPKFKKPMKATWKQSSPTKIKGAFKQTGSQTFGPEFLAHFPTRIAGPGTSGLGIHKEELSEFIHRALGIGHDVSTARQHHDKYAALREQFHSVIPKRIGPGVILHRKATADRQTVKDEWLVCVSPACDCAHGSNKRDYLFVGGHELTTPEKGREGTMQTCLLDREKQCHHVKWSSKKFRTFKWSPTSPENYEFFGQMHADFASGLIHAVWGHETRVGVSTSEFLRKERER
jgi:hypothetical protein